MTPNTIIYSNYQIAVYFRLVKVQQLSIFILIILLIGCSAGTVDYDNSPALREDDRENIPKPKGNNEDQLWDIIDNYFFYEIAKPLDFGWTARKIGFKLGLSGRKEADNLNSLDDSPNSTWFTHRHGIKRLSQEELIRGPNNTNGPDTSGTITIIKGKFEGGSLGFIVVDSRGDKYVLKFDGPGWHEMASAAEVITTKFFHAAGYNVPENHIFYFNPSQLSIDPRVTVPTPDAKKRSMTREDLDSILSDQPRNKEGKIRSLASKWLSGVPLGPFDFHGRRKDDLNDRVEHENRRELRGLRILSSWLGDTDRRMANTLDMYITDKNDNSYVKHYLIDMGSTLGSNWGRPHPPKYGNEYAVDIANIGKAFLMLGAYEDPWDDVDSVHYTSVGWIESEMFDPEGWVAVYPNAASENMTYRDAYWGAKIVMSFTDEDIKNIVKTGKISDPEAEKYLTRILIERRDKIVSHWFSKVNPLDGFKVNLDSTGNHIFSFRDLALDAGVVGSTGNRYKVAVRNVKENSITNYELRGNTYFLLPHISGEKNQIQNFEIELSTQRDSNWGSDKTVKVYVAYRPHINNFEVVAIRRDS